MIFPKLRKEKEILLKRGGLVAGCDEVGMGPVAGPVVAAACILDFETIGERRSKEKWYYRVRDSKTTSEGERVDLERRIKENCLAFGVGAVEPGEIDLINIHQAGLLAMRKAVEAMLVKLECETDLVHIILDGRFLIPNFDRYSKFDVSQEAIIGGDARVLSISAASIIAKVYRDGIMKQIHEQMPDYGFASHKGYNTKAHREAIARYGISPVHRRSFLHIV